MPDFDKFYDERELSFGEQPSLELKQHLERFPQGGTALDLGAGDGRNALYLARLGYKVTAVDVSRVGLEKLKTFAERQGLQDRITVEAADVRTWSYPTDAFELVVAVTVFDHLKRGEMRPVFRRMTECLRHGGLLYVKAYTIDDPGYVGDDRPASELSDAIHCHFGRNELLELARKEFHVVRYEEMREKDESHGRPHYHAFAKLLARKLPLERKHTPELQ